MTRRLRPLALLAYTMVGSCQMEASISIMPHGAQPTFVVTYDRGKTACVMGFTVTAVDGGVRKNVWAIRQKDRAPCTDRVTYAIVPAGYEAVVPARPLSPRRSYEVSASGFSWHASQPMAIR